MDKSWITKSRLSPEYKKDLNEFLDFAFANTIAEGYEGSQINEKDSFGKVLGKEQPGRVRGLGFDPSPTQVFGVTTDRIGSIPLDCSNGNNVVLQEEVSRLKLELQAANQHSNDLEKEIKCVTQRSEDRDKRVKGALNYIFKNLPGGVPSEFVDLLNSQVVRSIRVSEILSWTMIIKFVPREKDEIETSRNCAKVSTSEERQSFVQNLDQVRGWLDWLVALHISERVRSTRVSEIREIEGTQGIEE
ncbi:hypothetical protein G2W53_026221 [Senna tora]|uniref:Uncharacterized protein n=1 Tax=Senna tora TaxID=362788 RepID=A0A834TGK1_9FABA|nr:hypothetical protein G2W53_026221 [Senna tora]